MANEQKLVSVAIAGAPNAGKSTLTNLLVGTKISIVTNKVQTTRVSIKGIYTDGVTQVILTDTPGIFKPKKNLEKAIVKQAWQGVRSSDVVAILIDAKKGVCHDSQGIIKDIANKNIIPILVINKIDQIGREHLLQLAKEANDIYKFDATFMVSALKAQGIKQLKEYFVSKAIASPWPFTEDQVSDAPMRFFAAEVTREKLFHYLQQELPYSVSVATEIWQENDDGSLKINQVIYTSKSSHKNIVIGKSGQMIKKIGTASRKELEKIFECKVNLFLFAKVKEDWTSNDGHYQEVGFNW